MTQFIRDDFGDVQMVADDDPRVAAYANPNDVSAQIAARLAQQGMYQSPDGWAIVTSGPGGGGSGVAPPHIVLDRTGKQPPADILAKYPMGGAQETQWYHQQNAAYDASNSGGEGADIRNALITAVASYFGGSALFGSGGLLSGAGATGASPAAAAVGDAAWGVNPASTSLADYAASTAAADATGGAAMLENAGLTYSNILTPAAVAAGGAAAGGEVAAGGAFDMGGMGAGYGGLSGATPAASAAAGFQGAGADAIYGSEAIPTISGASGGMAAPGAGGTSEFFSSTAANSVPGGVGTTVPLGGDPGAYTPGFWDGMGSLASGVTGYGNPASAVSGSPDTGLLSGLAKTLGMDSGSLLKALGSGASAVIGAYASGVQGDKLTALAQQQMAAEQARYTEQRDINQTRYTEAQRLAAEATARGVATQDYAKGVVAPSQARYEGSFQPGFTMSNDPGFMDALNQSSKATLHTLSMNGNPAGSPNAWKASLDDNFAKFAYPAMKDYRTQNAATGYGGPMAGAAVGTPGYVGVGAGQTGFGNPAAGANESAAAIGANSNVFGSIGKGIANITSPPQTLSEWIAANQNKGSRIF